MRRQSGTPSAGRPRATPWTRLLPRGAHPHPHAGGRGDGPRAWGAGIGRWRRPRDEREVDFGVRSGKWLSLRHAQALLSALDITTTEEPRDRAIIGVPSAVSCAVARWRRSPMGACSGTLTPEATVAARRANTRELSA